MDKQTTTQPPLQRQTIHPYKHQKATLINKISYRTRSKMLSAYNKHILTSDE